jgi:uncharacterized protein YbjT (DUF2867 family)
VARALIVGCGCRGRELGRRLREEGWQVRGTSRDPGRLPGIEAAGLEAALADPDRAGTILDHVGDVTVVYWLLGSASGEPDLVAAVNGPRLERVLEKLVDTPVRGFVYEAAGQIAQVHLQRGAALVEEAASRWRIPVAVIGADPRAVEGWVGAMVGAAERLVKA